MIKLLHKIFHHRAWLLPIPIALIGTPIILLLHSFISWTNLFSALLVILICAGGIAMIVFGIVMIAWIFPE